MKKHKFKLAAVLKLREAREKKLKSELGEIVQEMQALRDRMSEIERELDSVYEAQEKSMETASTGRMLSFYPAAVQGLKADRQAKTNLLGAVERRYQRKVNELKVAMGETKVMNKLKEKDLAIHQKAVKKKEQETLEEIIMLRSGEKAS